MEIAAYLRKGRPLVVAVALAAAAGAADARDQIRIVGSSTVFPYTQAVAEQFTNMLGAPSPIVESTGTGGGMKIFCAGVGTGHPDVTGASRAMKSSEYELCASNGVVDVTEALIGFDGLSIAVSRGNDFDWNLTLPQIYLALANQVPVDGEWADNPYRNWNEIDSSLPDAPILAYGPPPTSGTRDAFVELAMHAGCEELAFVQDGGYDSGWVKENCSRMRLDGPFVEAGENDNLIVQKLEADADAFGIFGFSFLDQNKDKIQGSRVGGVDPTFDNIAMGDYSVSRSLYFYVKNAHIGVVPGIQEYVREFTSEDAWGPFGYLADKGLIPLPDSDRAAMASSARAAAPFSM